MIMSLNRLNDKFQVFTLAVYRIVNDLSDGVFVREIQGFVLMGVQLSSSELDDLTEGIMPIKKK